MYKLLIILLKIYNEKIVYKTLEYKQGFSDAIEIVKIHGNLTQEKLHEVETLNKKVEQIEENLKYFQDKHIIYKKLITEQREALGRYKKTLTAIRRNYDIAITENDIENGSQTEYNQ